MAICSKKNYGIILLFLVLSLAIFVAYAQDIEDPSEKINKYKPRIDVDYKLGNKRNLGRVDLLIPIAQNNDNLLFLD
ncbi:MAG: hypothetical protein ACJAZX_001411 [Rickettsiales bacterium]